MLEGLTKYWGFYLVAVPDANGVGINDFAEALAQFTEYWEWVTDLRSLDVTRRAAQDEVNSRIASRHLRRVLAARIVVFRLFLQLAIQVDGTLQEKDRRIWLWFQLSGVVLRRLSQPSRAVNRAIISRGAVTCSQAGPVLLCYLAKPGRGI